MSRGAHDAEPGAPQSLGLRLGLALALAVSSSALYWKTASFEFLNYDDNVYVTENASLANGLTGDSIGWAFTTFHAGNWHPLTWLSHLVDVELFGVRDAAGPHLVNAALHGLTAALFFLAFAAATRATVPSLFAAAFFALHPLRVESVAWVSERKDVLSGCLWAATVLAYVVYARRGGAGRYALVVALFALGLLAKPMAVTLPFALLLLDAWPLRRDVPWKRLVLEKLPLVALVVPFVLVTLRAQDQAMRILELDLPTRVGNAFAAVGAYVMATLAPTKLAVLYPHPADVLGETGFGIRGASWAAVVGALTLVAARLRATVPALLVGWMWFLGTLVPVIGIVQVGIHSHADRYTYVPSVGLALALAFGAAHVARERVALARALVAGGALWLAVLATLTWKQIDVWRSSITLMTHAAEVTDLNYMAYTNLAQALEGKREYGAAIENYERAVGIKGDSTLVRYQLGQALWRVNRVEEARTEFQRALATIPEPPMGEHPEYFVALVGLGITSSILGHDAEAVEHLSRAWRTDKTPPSDRLMGGQALAWILATSPDDDLRDCERAKVIAQSCLSMMTSPQLYEALAAAHAECGEWTEAIAAEERALELIPPVGQPEARARLALYRAHRPYRKP